MFCHGRRRHLRSFPTRRSSDLHVREQRVEIVRVVRLVRVDEGEPELLVPPERADRVERGCDPEVDAIRDAGLLPERDRKSTRLNSSHVEISYAVFCLKKKIMSI